MKTQEVDEILYYLCRVVVAGLDQDLSVFSASELKSFKKDLETKDSNKVLRWCETAAHADDMLQNDTYCGGYDGHGKYSFTFLKDEDGLRSRLVDAIIELKEDQVRAIAKGKTQKVEWKYCLEKNEGEAETYLCGICSQEYLRKDIRDTCESKPAADLAMKLGSVFECDDGIIGFLYDTRLEKQTHELTYVLARGQFYEDAPIFTGGVLVDEAFIRKSRPVSEEKFDKTKILVIDKTKILVMEKMSAMQTMPEHLQKLSLLEFIRYQGDINRQS